MDAALDDYFANLARAGAGSEDEEEEGEEVEASGGGSAAKRRRRAYAQMQEALLLRSFSGRDVGDEGPATDRGWPGAALCG